MNDNPHQPIMQIRNIGIAFGGVRAVDDVSLDVERRRITTIIGPNGAGKSTLFNLVSGALRPHTGQVLIDGVDMTGLSPERSKAAGLSRSFQITNLFPELTVGENLRLAAHVLEPMFRAFLPLRKSVRARHKTDEMLERFQLCRRRDELAGNLSHGDQRRLEIAVCLASEPKILLLDEPTQGMSHADTADTAQLVRSLTDDVSVLLIEHDIGLVMQLSDHIMVMHQGRKLAEGSPKAVRADPAVQAAYFGHA
jgi:branched-chain amino acid transport system ATP-binding protein